MTGAIKALPTLPTSRLLVEGLKTPKSNQFNNWVPPFHPHGVRYSEPRWGFRVSLVANTSSAGVSSEFDSGAFPHSQDKIEHIETNLEKVIYGCRFFAILAVWGSLLGSFLCFIKGCGYVVASFQEYFVNRGKVIFSLVEALDVYLLGTVMLVFGMGLYELFISNLDKAKSISDDKVTYTSNFFGLFTLKDRPQWLGIKSVDELKTKLGHVIVMLLLIGFFDKTRKATILSSLDLLCFAASVLLSSGCLYLLSKLHSGE
ncbi:OLC1v1030787C1 [Oldenlandia corymbosa var. corymbosa]|uniref:OLC1v1030787C1 n=1 Tax=Oldenlandia corymbosa var. corymbosa TaxID=529605 RepID=A0AAV1CGZ6_OLDCO|nr:OLC1v1030787C1 [Oldenlandia corymbosa var. corymbosa]